MKAADTKVAKLSSDETIKVTKMSGKEGYVNKNKTTRKVLGHATGVDVVTGKTKVEYFLDPTLIINETGKRESSYESSQRRGPTMKRSSSSLDLSEKDSTMYSSKFLYMPCAIVKTLDDEVDGVPSTPDAVPALVKTSDGTLHKISDSSNLIPLRSPEDYIGVSDLLHLPHVTEASLLHTLRLRHKRGDIYTSAGPVLISVNPYKDIVSGTGESIYSEEKMMIYRQKGAQRMVTASRVQDQLPPHVFDVADRAYARLTASATNMKEADDTINSSENEYGVGCSQSIIISGESGAGKTHATKVIMQYLARITSEHHLSEDTGKFAASLEERVLSSNPLLESFGNAQTLHNDNSSRFGKYIRISFSTTSGAMMGASITNYLLEKTRLTTQVEGERNFHIFYQLLAGLEESRLEELGLNAGASTFYYLTNRDYTKARRDKPAYEETKRCLDNIGLSAEEQKEVFEIVAAVLHLGNVEFEEKGDQVDGNSGEEHDNAQIAGDSGATLDKACKLLGLEKDAVEAAMLTKLITVGGKTIHKPQNVTQAYDKRDAFAKLTYSSLFEWLVKRVNETIVESSPSADPDAEVADRPKPKEKVGSIGVLDIYGFESFDTNGFETLLINYANERLQRHFNRHLFEVEQNLYTSEGVDWAHIDFKDNYLCLELIEGGQGKKMGLLSTLDDAWDGMGSVSEKNDKFVSHLHHLFGGQQSRSGGKKKGEEGVRHPHYITPKFGNDRQFIVIHYAGEVRYTANDFVEKNVETLSNELKDLGQTSTGKTPSEVYECTLDAAPSSGAAAKSPRRSTIRGVSVSSQFRSSLRALVADLEETQPNYIRCVKPNLTKSPGNFESGQVLRQLRYAGMMDMIKIQRAGYSLREEHERFYDRFSVLLTSEELKKGAGIAPMVDVLSGLLGATEVDWQIGHSKIFVRQELADKLETLVRLRVVSAARTVGRFGRDVAQKRASMLLTAWMRLRLVRLRQQREFTAASRICASYRGHKQREVYLATREAAITIQSLQRRKMAVNFVDRLRDPYGDMTFKDLKELVETEESRMDEAIKSKDFRSAADIEKKLEPLRKAMEEKRPLTRALLEEMIEDVQKRMDDALQRKAFSECVPLQAQLDSLTAKRSEVPTVAEFRERVREAEAEAAAAINRKDFAVAALAQEKVDDLRKQLEDLLTVEGGEEASHFQSRAELEAEIDVLTGELESAVQSKDFAAAAALQEKVDKLKLQRDSLPSISDLEARLSQLKDDMEAAVARKDFKGAGTLHEQIEQMEKTIQTEKGRDIGIATGAQESKGSGSTVVLPSGESKQIHSRLELEQEIVSCSDSLSRAVKSKDFKKAGQVQSCLDELHQMRSVFPNLQELEDSKLKSKIAMENAVSTKNFALADKLHQEIEDIEKKISRERSQSETISRVGAGAADALSRTTETPTRVVSVSSKPKVIADTTRPVYKLRPRKPIITSPIDSVLVVSQTITKARGHAALIKLPEKGYAGVMTPHHVVERVVAKGLDAASIPVASIMKTKKAVALTDSAGEALTNMLENRHRYLPVMDDGGALAGILDIGQCLGDAITKLEQANTKTSSAAEDVVKQMATLRGASHAHAEAVKALLAPVLEQAFGEKVSPTLRTLLAGKPSTIVSTNTSVLAASKLMSEADKAALVVDNGELIGIVTVKNLMERAVAKKVPMDATPVTSIMTPHPLHVSPDVTSLEALQIMHEDHELALPVCEDDGTVIGSVDVMDVIFGCGGAEGWRAIFESSNECPEDASDAASSVTFDSKIKLPVFAPPPPATPVSVKQKKVNSRPVYKLRPKKPIITKPDDSVMTVAKTVTAMRGDAALIKLQQQGYAGVMTPHHITDCVLSKNLDPATTPVSAIMKTKQAVAMSDSAGEALSNMLENKHRYLPVIDDSFDLVGILDIGQCLVDAISLLEKAHEPTNKVAQDVVKQVTTVNGESGAHVEALQALLAPVLAQAFGEKEPPSLRDLLEGKPSTVVGPDTTVREASILISENEKAALVVEDGELIGIVTVKELMQEAVAKDVSPDTTPVADIMTHDPEHVSPDINALEALQIMHTDRVSSLPVVDGEGHVLGSVDVLDLIYACGDERGWRAVFDSSNECDNDVSEAASADGRSGKQSTPKTAITMPMASPQSNANKSIPRLVEIPESGGQASPSGSHLQFKVVFPDRTRRFRCEPKLKKIMELIGGDKPVELSFTDDEGDEVIVTSDECLMEAISHSEMSGNQAVKLVAKPTADRSSWWDSVKSVKSGVNWDTMKSTVKKSW